MRSLESRDDQQSERLEAPATDTLDGYTADGAEAVAARAGIAEEEVSGSRSGSRTRSRPQRLGVELPQSRLESSDVSNRNFPHALELGFGQRAAAIKLHTVIPLGGEHCGKHVFARRRIDNGKEMPILFMANEPEKATHHSMNNVHKRAAVDVMREAVLVVDAAKQTSASRLGHSLRGRP